MEDWFDYGYGEIPTLFITLYAVIIFLGVMGNMMVIIVVLKTKDMKNSTNIFLMNLAIADLIMLLLTAPSSLLEIIFKTVIMEKELCRATKFLRRVMVNSSVLTILALSFERYYAICKPLRAGYICTNKRAAVICAVVWFFAALSASPTLGVFKFERNARDVGAKKTNCAANYGIFWIDAAFIVNTTLFFFIPLIIMVIIYSLIIKNLIVNSAMIDNNTVNATNYANVMRYRKQVVFMLVVVVISFFVCFLPREVLIFSKILMNEHLRSLLGSVGIRKTGVVVAIMRLLHSVLNPIFYNLISTKFREEFAKLLGINKLMRWCRIKEESKKNIQIQLE